MAVHAAIGRGGKFIDVSLAGDKELEASLRALPFAVQGKFVRRGIRSAMRVVQSRAKALSPRRSGRLAGGDWKVRASKRKGFVGLRLLSPTRASLRISPDATGYYPFSLEFGFSGRRSKEELRQNAHMSRLRRALKRAMKRGTDEGGVSAQISVRAQLADSQRPTRVRRRFPGRHYMRTAILGDPETLISIMARECDIQIALMTPKGIAAAAADAGAEAA